MNQGRTHNRQDNRIVIVRLLAYMALASIFILAIVNIENQNNDDYQTFVERYRRQHEDQEQAYGLYEKLKGERPNQKGKDRTENTEYHQNIDQFSEITREEYGDLVKAMNDIRMQKDISIDVLENPFYSKYNVSWIDYLPPIKDRGRCHADYAFAVVGALEAMINIKNNKTTNHSVFSDQQVIDCCENCTGCRPEEKDSSLNLVSSLEYLKNHGVQSTYQYPYQGLKESCMSTEQGTRIKKYRQLMTFKDIKEALEQGPIIVTLDGRNFWTYLYGIFSNCGRRKTTHALVVGRTSEYFVVRTAYSRRWGQKGYMKLAIGYTCGLITQAYAVTV